MGAYFSICSLVYLIIFMFFFFSKDRVKNIETKIYKVFLITTFIGVSLDILGFFLYKNGVSPHSILYESIAKLMLIYFVAWSFVFSYYIYAVSFKKVDTLKEIKMLKDVKIFLIGIFLIQATLLLMLPISFEATENAIYPVGASVVLTYIIFASAILISTIVSFIRMKSIITKKYTPLYLFLVMIVIIFAIQSLYPDLFLVNFSLVLLVVIMYFTIENPDVKLLNQLELAKNQAEKANRAKSEFLSSMSHEIRTPLNAIVGFSEFIIEENNMELIREDASNILAASQNLLEIVNGILDISKIEANKMEMIEIEYELLPTLKTLATLIVPRIGEKPIEFKTNFAPDLPKALYGDKGKLKQIITNILTNAVKYTEKGTIEFNVSCINEKDETTLVIVVKDTGRGIKKEKIENLFNKFQRLEEDRNTTIEGTGLGLAITKSLVELMGGKIIVQSEYGIGSTFTVYIKQKIINDTIFKKEEETEIYNFNGSKILVVDDNTLNLKVIDKILKSYGINTTLITSGFECIEKINNNEKYDLILMDDMMPKINGKETLLKLKENPNFKIPTVVLTANAITGVENTYLSLGFNGYLSKPVDRKELNKILNKYLIKSDKKEIKEIKKEIPNKLDYLKNRNIDVDKGIELLGSIEMYDEILNTFLKENVERLPKLLNFKEQNDCENYAIISHAIKSDSKYLGFTDLATISYNHEMNGKQNNIDYINKHYDSFINEIDKITQIANYYLNDLDNKGGIKMEKTIIVADDSLIMQNILESAIPTEFKILKAKNGKEAIDIITENDNITGILLDLNMPTYDGFVTLDYLKENNLFRNIPVSIISGDDTKSTIEKTFGYDIVDMINKPFSTESIKLIIEKMERFKEEN